MIGAVPEQRLPGGQPVPAHRGKQERQIYENGISLATNTHTRRNTSTEEATWRHRPAGVTDAIHVGRSSDDLSLLIALCCCYFFQIN